MKIRSMNRLLAAGLFSAVLSAGCSHRDEATLGTPENPIVVVFSPAHAPTGSDALLFIKKHLENATRMSVDIKIAESPAATIKLFNTGVADAGFVTLEEYLVAREEYGVRVLLQALRANNMSDYDGVILTRAKDGPAAISGLSGKKVGFVGPYSLSGFTLPAIYLKKAGVKVAPDFAPTHDANINKLLSGEVYAAASYERQAARFPGLKILAHTGRAPNEPVIVRGSLPMDKREALKSAFLSIGDTPEGKRALGEVADITGFASAGPDVYRPIHELILAEGQAVYDLVPGGWEIYKLNRPYIPDR